MALAETARLPALSVRVAKWLIEGDYEQDREFRRRVHRWLGEIWQEKDDLLQQMLMDAREQ